jgi:hypothetical protein
MGKCEIKKMSTSTVGLPRLSKIARALRDLMVAMAMAMARESERDDNGFCSACLCGDGGMRRPGAHKGALAMA